MEKSIILELMNEKVNFIDIRNIINIFDTFNKVKSKVYLGELRKYSFNKGLIQFLCNKTVHAFNNMEDILLLIKELAKCNFRSEAVELLTNETFQECTNIEEQLDLLNMLKTSGFDRNVLSFLVCEDVIGRVGVYSRIEILKAFIRDGKNRYCVELITNKSVLTYRGVHEIIDLMTSLKECNSSRVLKLMCDDYLLFQLSNDETLKLVQELKKCNYNDLVLSVMLDSNVIHLRSVDEIIEMVEKLREYQFEENVFQLVIEPNILYYRNSKNQIEMMGLLYRCKNRKWILKAFTKFCGFSYNIQLKIIDKLVMYNNEKLMNFIFENLEFLEKTSEEFLFPVLDKLISCDFSVDVTRIIRNFPFVSVDMVIDFIDNELNNERYISFDEAIRRITNKKDLKRLLTLVEEDTEISSISEREFNQILRKKK